MMRCDKCGSIDESHVCAGKSNPRAGANDNAPDKVVPFNYKEWRRAYMRHYMRRLRQRLKEARK